MKYEKGKKITDKCQFKKGKKYVAEFNEVFTFSHIGEDGAKYFKDEGQEGFYVSEKEYNCIGFGSGVDFYEAIEVQELPDEGLVVYKEHGTIIYRTGEGSGYGYDLNSKEFKVYEDDKGISWSFKHFPQDWRPATPEEKTKFIELLKKECERRGLREDTKIKSHADNNHISDNHEGFRAFSNACRIWNQNGCIFYKGKFAEPLEEKEVKEMPEVRSIQHDGKEKETTLDDKITELIELGRSKGLKINVTFE